MYASLTVVTAARGADGEQWFGPAGTDPPNRYVGAAEADHMTETAVVAGVGPGLGSSVARRFAEDGAAVGLFARSTEYVEELADDLDVTTPGTAAAVPTDLTDGEAVADGFAAVRERFGPVDALVVTAFADGAGDGGGILDAETADLAAAWETRVLGSFRCARAAAADMRRGDGGTVLLTNSAAATTPSASLPPATARHALRGLARSMDADPELGAAGVQTVHVIVDGWIDKPSSRAAYPDHERWMDPDEIADRLHGLAAAETVHAGEIDLRHPRDEPSF